MKRRIIRIIAGIALAGILTSAFAVPAKCGSYVNFVPVVNVNSGTILAIDIGNELTKKVNIGAGVASIQGIHYCEHYEHCHNQYYYGCNQYLATGTNAGGPALPYTQIKTATPAAKTILANAAKSMGCVPGDAFGLEIGQFFNNVYTPNASLLRTMNFEIYGRTPVGYTPAMIALLSSGAIVVLSPLEFDQSLSSQWYTDGSRYYQLHTMYPNAVYMMVYMKQ